VVNKITRSLREKILDGFGKEDGVTSFVRDLKRDCPGAAAALLARLLPPADEKPEGAGGTVIVNILPIASGNFFVDDPPQLVDETAARQIAGTDDAVPMLEHLSTEEANAAPVEILVVRHSGFDGLIPSQLRIGKFSGGTRISMLLGAPA
jgi:hypothetical protein